MNKRSAGYVLAEDLNRALRVSERLEVGMVGLNTGLVSNPESTSSWTISISPCPCGEAVSLPGTCPGRPQCRWRAVISAAVSVTSFPNSASLPGSKRESGRDTATAASGTPSPSSTGAAMAQTP
jgi:hypothetical protein